MKKLLLILLCFPLLVFSQDEKRLALVIGNSDYQYLPKLPNPVGDALLIAQTLDSLGFDVTLDTNISTARNFLDRIIEFGAERDSFEVGFIFYAGHGMQVNGQNYLLPTKEEFSSEIEVERFGVPAEMVMRYLTAQSDQVNVLILDACRNNPLENYRGGGSGGLAAMQAKGSLIAFSTTAGNVAKDGDGDHSVYCTSLAKNMLKEGIDLNQVFRNVRKEVMDITGQATVNYDQLTGNAFYLVQKNFIKEFKEVETLFQNHDAAAAIELLDKIIPNRSSSNFVYYYLGSYYSVMGNYTKSKKNYYTYIELEPQDAQAYANLGYVCFRMSLLEESLSNYSTAINLRHLISDTNWLAEIFAMRGHIYDLLGNKAAASSDMEESYSLNPYNTQYYLNQIKNFLSLSQVDSAVYYCDLGLERETYETWGASLYLGLKGLAYYKMSDFIKAEKYLTDAIQINSLPIHLSNLYNIRSKIYFALGQISDAKNDCEYAIETNPKDAWAYYNLGVICKMEKRNSIAIRYFEKAKNYMIEGSESPNKYWYIENNIISLTDIYILLGDLWQLEKEIELMCGNYKKACDLDDCERANIHCK
jgi:tetratricopeptide (TPR) repeat protein